MFTYPFFAKQGMGFLYVVEDIKENSATLDSALIPKHAQN